MGYKRAFFILQNELLDDGYWAKMSCSAKAVYVVLSRYRNVESNEAYPSYNRIAELAGISRRAAINGIKELEKLGVITRPRATKRQKKAACAQHHTNRYHLVHLMHQGSELNAPGSAAGAPGDETGSPELVSHVHPNKTNNTNIHKTTTIEGGLTINVGNGTADEDTEEIVVAALKKFFSDRTAKRLASQHDPGYLREKIDITRFNQERGNIKDPAAFLRRAIQDDFDVPVELKAERKRRSSHESQFHAQQVIAKIAEQDVKFAREKTSDLVFRVTPSGDKRVLYLEDPSGSVKPISRIEDLQHYDFE
jgi:DNA-binding Lrp family transcriptional regulator